MSQLNYYDIVSGQAALKQFDRTECMHKLLSVTDSVLLWSAVAQW